MDGITAPRSVHTLPSPCPHLQGQGRSFSGLSAPHSSPQIPSSATRCLWPPLTQTRSLSAPPASRSEICFYRKEVLCGHLSTPINSPPPDAGADHCCQHLVQFSPSRRAAGVAHTRQVTYPFSVFPWRSRRAGRTRVALGSQAGSALGPRADTHGCLKPPISSFSASETENPNRLPRLSQSHRGPLWRQGLLT